MKPRTFLLWVGSYTDPGFPVPEAGKGITALEFDSQTGGLSLIGVAAPTRNPSYLAVHPNGETLYAVNELMGTTGSIEGTVTAFRVGPAGDLEPLNTVSSGGEAPCHLALDGSGRHLFVANYGSGSVAHLPLTDRGRLAEPAIVQQHTGSGPTDRQTGPHAHMTALSKDQRFLYAADLGCDAVLVSPWNPVAGRLEAVQRSVATAAGAGPRHLWIHPGLDCLYVVGELNGTIEVFAIEPESGTLNRVQTVSTTDEPGKGFAGSAAIRGSNDGRFLYVSNRGEHHSIAVFSVDPVLGTLRLIQVRSSEGRVPRDILLDPTERFLLAANQESGTVVSLRRDPVTGVLSEPVSTVTVPLALSLVFQAGPSPGTEHRPATHDRRSPLR